MTETEYVIDIESPRALEKQFFFDPMEQDVEMIKEFTGLSPYTRRKINKAVADTKSAEMAYLSQTGYGILNLAEPPYNFDELAMFFDTSPTNHAAIVAKVKNTVGIGYGFETSVKASERLQSIPSKEGVAKAQKKIDKIRSEILHWLNELNEEESLQQILDKVATDFEVYGNGYLEVGRTVTGQIGYLGHIPASTVRRRRKKDGYVQIVGNHITFFNNFGQDNHSPITNDPRPNEIIHLLKYSPRSTFYGVPDSVSCSTAIVGDSLAAQYNLKYFDNSATPRYIATLTGGRLSKNAEDKLFKFLQSSIRGNPHRTLFMPLPLDMNGNPVKFEMKRVDDELNDGSWDRYRALNKQDILVAHGVPLSRIGGESGDGVATSLASDRMFKEQVIIPTQSIFEKAINRIVQERTDIVTFDLNELSLIDELAQSQIDERMLRNRVVKPNEVRPRLGLPTVPEGEEFLEVSAGVKAEQNAQAKGSRERDKERVANNSDSATTVSGRNPQGTGSKE